jgi:hypothetical protein
LGKIEEGKKFADNLMELKSDFTGTVSLGTGNQRLTAALPN